jgi:hypothetical protein
MVRFLKVKELEERRRLLVARSELYRQTLRLEIASLKYAALELRHRFGFLSIARRLLGVVASTASLFRRGTGSEKGGGFVSKLFSGLQFAAGLLPLLKKFGRSSTGPEKPEEAAATDHSH